MRASDVLTTVRLRAGLTQAEVAAHVGTTQSAIARLERGENSPSWDRVVEIVQACNHSLDVSIVVPDPVELATIRASLNMTIDERWRRAVSSARFVLAGRVAMNAKQKATTKRR
jgi:transcriptional regulator with XRE-family HTH domain